MRLRPCRNNSRRENVFVRLHPETVRALCEHARSIDCSGYANAAPTAKPSSSFFWNCSITSSNNNNYDWTMAATNVALDFLPLKLTWDDGIVRYASYNGGSVENTTDVTDIIEIPQNLFPELVVLEDQTIYVEIVPFCPAASKVSMMLISTNHYELICQNRHWLEDRALLGQVSVISSHQVLHITITAQDGTTTNIIPLRVECIHSAFPNPCWRLVDSSEVVFLPPPNDESATLQEYLLQRIPCRQDIIDCVEMEVLEQRLIEYDICATARWIQLPPKTVAIHEGENLLLSTEKHQRPVIAMLRRNHLTAIVRVLSSTHVPKGCIAMHSLVGQQLDTSPVESSLFVTEFALTLLDDAVVEEKASAFLDSILPNTLSLRKVHFKRSQEDLPFWNTPPSFLSVKRTPSTTPVHDECLDLPEALQAMDPDTPIALNDLIVITRNVDMPQHDCGRIVTTSGGDTSVFGFVGDVLEKFFSVKTYSVLNRNEPLKLLLDTLVLRPNLVEFIKSLGSQHPGCVICGEMGTGKTHSAIMLANIKKLQSGSKVVYLDCRALKYAGDGRMSNILEQITTLDGQDTFITRPVTLIVDNVDVFAAGKWNREASAYGSAKAAGTEEERILDQSKLLLDTLGAKITCLRESCSSTFVVLTCTPFANLDQFLKDYNFWGTVYTISPLNVTERSLMFRSSIERLHVACPEHLDFRFGKLTIGYRCHDFDKFALRLCSLYSSPSSAEIEDELHRFTPICRIGTSSSSQTDALIKMDDIGALFEAKRLLEETVIRPSRYRRIYDAAKTRLPKGLLLYGPPGCGKTALASALANECGYSMIICNGPELLDKYIGVSESRVRELFYRAASAAPSILFFDEFDSLAPRRGTDSSGVTDRIVNQLLTFLDGVSELSKTNEGNVYIVAATSRPDKIDPALLRPGRLEKHIFCGIPDGDVELRDLIQKIAAKYPLDIELANAAANGDLVSTARGMSGADVDALFSAAHTAAIHEALGEAVRNSDPVVAIKMDHFRIACDDAVQSIPQADLTRLRSIYSAFSRKKTMKKAETSNETLRVVLR